MDALSLEAFQARLDGVLSNETPTHSGMLELDNL